MQAPKRRLTLSKGHLLSVLSCSRQAEKLQPVKHFPNRLHKGVMKHFSWATCCANNVNVSRVREIMALNSILANNSVLPALSRCKGNQRTKTEFQ